MNLAYRIRQILTLDPAAPAMEFEGKWHSWHDLRTSMEAIEKQLDGAGLGEGARIGVLLRNHVSLVPAVLSVVASNRCLVTLNPVFAPDKLAEDIQTTAIPAVIGLADDLDPVQTGDAIRSSRALCIALGPTPADPLTVRQNWSGGADDRVFAPDTAIEMLTSGTTGAPKRIPMTRTGFETSVFAAARFEKGRETDDKPALRSGVQLLMAPFSHIGGLLALMNAIMAGRKSVLLTKFNVQGFRDAVRRYDIKVASAPPAALKMILDANVPKAEISSLRAFRTGTAPLDPDLADAFYDRYGIPVLQNYGATEFGGVAGWTLRDFESHRFDKRGAVGRLNPGVKGRVVNPDTGEPVPYGSVGILELQSPQINDGATWMRTTDLARLDTDNFLWIVGRADNVIIRGGFKIQPDDIVKAMERHPAVREAAVIALSDERLGQVPGAAYIVKSGHLAPSPEDMSAFLKTTLSPYQVPSVFLAVETLPRTPSMKVDAAKLREMFAKAATAC